MQRVILLACALLVSSGAFAGAHEAAGDTTDKDGTQQVRVAGGGTMEYAGSSKSDAEWQRQRPDYERLKPRNDND